MTILNQENPAHLAAAGRLQAEPIIWLTSVAGSGQPQSTPVWFLWEAGEFLVYGAATGPKIRNIESNPHVSMHLEGNGRGGANVIFECRAGIDPACRRPTPCPPTSRSTASSSTPSAGRREASPTTTRM